MAPQKTSSELPAPLRAPVTALRKVPGAGVVTKAAGGALDAVGTVSPRGRRVAVYTGAGLLGVAGVVEWPIALTVAGVAWLTQPKPGHDGNGAATTTGAAKTAASKSSTAKRTTSSRGSGKTATAGRRSTSTSKGTTSSRGKAGASGGRSSSTGGRRKATTSGG
ncbi:hypothetical protein AB0O67_15790 [Streptomyces sp. NPDC086077]|uniref:hypothetical protein n=1 Tax=Streptomyces sp. NPDC086077 TaxID=3154862 RepID=UPI00343301B7